MERAGNHSPVNDVSVMEKSNGTNDFRRIKSTPGFREFSLSLNVEHEIATWTKLHHEEQVTLR